MPAKVSNERACWGECLWLSVCLAAAHVFPLFHPLHPLTLPSTPPTVLAKEASQSDLTGASSTGPGLKRA